MTPGLSSAVSAPAILRVRFDRPATRAASITDGGEALEIALPLLGGLPEEIILPAADSTHRAGAFTVFGSGQWRGGFAVAPGGMELEAAAAALYDGLFAAAGGRHLYRIWNYVPRINEVAHGLENYRSFCRGRSLAFERNFGAGFRKLLPAASAVGTTGGPLAVAFLAGDAVPHHFENPRQVPAFEYPPQYGPRPPSFARATTVTLETGRHVIISGTAAITGHATIAAGDLARQLDCTLENLGLIATAAGAPEAFRAGSPWTRRFKVYVRHAGDLARISARLHRHLLQPGDSVSYLQADLCRSELLVEIEAILTASA